MDPITPIILLFFVLFIGYLFLKGIEGAGNLVSRAAGKGKNSSLARGISWSILAFILFLAWIYSL